MLVATDGEHDFFAEEAKNLRDLRTEPLKIGGYALRLRQGHSHVRIEDGEFRRLQAHLLELAARPPAEPVARAFWCVPWEPFAPVRSQLFGLLAGVNERRKRAGREPVPAAAIRRRRRLVRPFERLEAAERQVAA